MQTELDTQEFQINAPTDSQKEQRTNPFDIVYPAEHLEDNTTITCKIAIQIKCHDGRRYILVPDGNAIVLPNSDQQSTQVKTHQSNAILQAVAEVHAWKEQFMRGDLTTKQLAIQIGKSDTYFVRTIKVAALITNYIKANHNSFTFASYLN